MKKGRYIMIRMKQEKESLIIGIVSSGIFTSVTALILGFSGLTYYDPPPPEKPDIVIDFNEMLAEDKKPEQRWDGARPKAEEVTKKVELVQQSEAQHKGATQNVAEEATTGADGDVERPEPPRKEINKKALFAAADNKGQKDTLAAQTAREVTEALKAGHALGNIEEGKTDGQPKAELKGCSACPMASTCSLIGSKEACKEEVK